MEQDEVLRYDVFEAAIHSTRECDNPYAVDITGVFRDEQGNTLNVTGFYDGADCYKVRFMPECVGCWDYSLQLNGCTVKEDRFLCRNSEIKGPLRQDPVYPYHFVFSNGLPFYMMGNTAYHAILSYRQHKEEFCNFLDYYQQRRFNWIRFFLLGASKSNLDDEIWPWGGTSAQPDFARINQKTFRDAEGVIQELTRRNMIASVILLTSPSLAGFSASSDKLKACKDYFRYAVSRLGAYWNVVWNVSNEWNKFGINSVEEIDELGEYLHSIDPYRRLTACHHYARFEFFDRDWTDMSSLQHRGLPCEINRVILQNRIFNKIVLNEEYGYEGDNNRPPNDADNVRHDHWAIAMAGGFGTYGDKTKGQGTGAYFSARLADAAGTEAPDKLRFLPSFMENTGYQSMTPANAYLSSCNPEEVFCLAEIGREYIVYLVRGQTFKLNLSHARLLKACWYNPRSGEYLTAWEIRVPQSMLEVPMENEGDKGWYKMYKEQNISFTPPDCENDWVLHLKEVSTEGGV